MEPMSLTLPVSRLETSRKARLRQPLNMEDILVTLPVSRPDRSREARPEQ